MHGTKREQSLLIGVEPAVVPSEAFLLAQGRSLRADGSREILLTQEQAKNLQASVGDTIQVVTRNALGRMSELDFTVAGIGDFVMLSLFSYKACFVDISSARALFALRPEEATDLLVFLPERRKPRPGASGARDRWRGNHSGFHDDAELSNETFTSEEGKMPDQKKPDTVRISTWQDMGKTFRGVGDAIFVSLAMLVVFLMVIVSILIVNLVSLMGIERYREIGTLRAIGYSRGLVVRLFMAEIMSVSTLAVVLGTGAGILLVMLLGSTGVPAHPRPGLCHGQDPLPPAFPGRHGPDLRHHLVLRVRRPCFPALRACSLKPAETLREE